MNSLLQRILRPHQHLPHGVHDYPTVLGKRRFEMLVLFNGALGFYIAIHQLLMPITLWLLQTQRSPRPAEIGFWYLYHAVLAALMLPRWRSPRTLHSLAYVAWFGMGGAPLLLVSSVVGPQGLAVSWKMVSGLLCYVTSLLLTLFLLYRLRMPTTAFLYGMPDRLLPRWRFALPSLALGSVCALLLIQFVHPLFAKVEKQAPPPRIRHESPRAIYQ
jgi:hypothetical protein